MSSSVRVSVLCAGLRCSAPRYRSGRLWYRSGPRWYRSGHVWYQSGRCWWYQPAQYGPAAQRLVAARRRSVPDIAYTARMHILAVLVVAIQPARSACEGQ
eukprot:1815952-Rhodomonas_salina.2